MTKQEILDKYITCRCWPAKDGGKVYNVSCPQHSQDPETAMDEWAEQEAILFGEWIKLAAWSNSPYLVNPVIWRLTGNYLMLHPDAENKEYTTTELLQLFKNQTHHI